MTQEEKNVTAPASRTAGWPSPFDDMDEWFDALQRRWLSHSLLGHGWYQYGLSTHPDTADAHYFPERYLVPLCSPY